MTDPIVPIIGGQRPETELQQRLREVERNRVVYSLNQAMRRDPNKVAERVNLNLSATVDDYIVAEEKRRRDVERITGRTAMSPATSEWLSNPDYSSISWDDADNLAKVERGITGTIGDIFTELAGGTLDTIFGAATAILSLPERMIESYRTAGYSPPAFRKMLLEDLQRQGYTGRQLKRIEQQITPQTQEEWIQEGGILPSVSSVLKQAQEGLAAGQVVSQQLVTAMRTPLKDLLGREGVDPSSTRAAVYSGFRSLPAMLAVAPLYPVLGVHGAGAAFVVPIYGNSYNRAIAEGLDPNSAHVKALGDAGTEYLTNIIPGGKFLAGMKLKSPLFQRIKDQLPAEIVQENIATAAQDLLDMAFLDPEKTFEEYLRERPQAAWHTIVATTVGVGALNTAVRAAERLTSRVDRETQATEAGGEMLSDLIENVRQTETQKRSPKVAAHFQNLALETKGLESVRIESEVLSQILSESEQQAEFLQEFPGIAQQLNQNGTDPGTEVEMKTGDFVSLVALNEKYQDIATKMQPNLRVGTAEFSLAEESAIEEERRAIREGLDDQMQDTIAREERNAEQRALIRKELESFAAQMPNISPKKARDQAEIAVTAWENLAKANEMEVGELWELMKPTLVAGEITIPELPGRGALFQPEQIDAPYTAAIEAGDMETAQRLVLDAAKRAGYSEQVYEHATDQEFDVFDINAPRVNAAKGGNPAGLYFSLGQTKYEGKRIVRAVLKYTKLYDLFGKNEIPDSAVEAYKQALRDEKLSPNEFWLNEKAEKFRKTGRMPTTGLSRLAQTRVIQRAGYDGIKDGQDVAVFSPEQVKVVDPITRDAEGNIIPLSQRFDVTQESILYAPDVSPNIDAAHMAAAEAGDMDMAQRLSDEAAKRAGYTVAAYHATNEEQEYDVFLSRAEQAEQSGEEFEYDGYEGGNLGTGFYFAEQEGYARRFGKKIRRFYLKIDNLVDARDPNVIRELEELEQEMIDDLGAVEPGEVYDEYMERKNADGIIASGVSGFAQFGETEILVKNSNQIKLADAVTYDKQGNIIPLSQRFDVTQESILYAPETGGDQRRGAYLPRSMQIILTEKADASTLIHEFTHHYLHTLSLLARNENAPEAITSQFQTLLDWFGVADINAWDALPAEQKAVHHEAFTYNFEIFIGSGKAPTKKLETVFTRVAKWMRGIYGKIRSTLNEAYKKETKRLTGVEKDLPALTADVRQVFETMLGAEAEVAEAAADLPVIPIYRTQEESGMSDEVWEAYNQDAELYIDQATNELTARTARAQKWLDNATARVIRAKTKQAKQQRKAIRDRIQAEVEQEPVYRAITMLRRGIYVDEQGNERKVEGQHRLNTKLVQELFPKDPAESGYVDLSPLRAGRYGMLAKDGVDPAVVANQFGFASAADLIKALVAARPINDVINEQTDAEIVERHPELKPEAIKQAAMEALHNDALARFKATELKFLAGINKSVRVIVEAARREAAAEIARMSYRSIKPSKFLAAERRAGKAAQRWMATGDRQAYAEQAAALRSAQKALREATELGDSAAISQAEQDVQQARQVLEQEKAKAAEQPGRATVDAVIRAKWNELYQGLLYREAVAARKRFTKHAKYLRRIAKQKDRGKKIGADHSEQIDHILRRLDIRGVSARTDQQRQAERVKFQAWLDDQSKSGMEYPISDAALEVASLRSIEQIPIESLDDIVDAIEQIYHAGNRIRNAFLMARNKRLDEIKKEIIDNVVKYAGKIKPSNVTPNTVLGRAKKSLHVFLVQHIKTSTKAYVIDGGEYGAFWNTIIRTANRNQGAEQIEVSDVTKQLQGIMEPFYAAGSMTQDSGAVMPRRVYNAETGQWSDDPNRAPRSLSREEVFVLALDLGNDSNIQRVVDGFGITEDEAKQIVSVLTTDELKAVQKIWDLFASFKPRVSEMERRLNGKEPTYLTPKPITLISNDGTQVELSGGYFPVKYDRSASELGTSIEAATQAKMQLDGAFIGNQTRDSYKKTRVARVVNRPLLLQASRMFSGLNEIIHDIHWREWLVDINLIMRPDGSVSRAIIENYGAEWMEDIRRWIKDIAAAGPGPMHPAEQWLGLMRRFISISRLGFSPVTAAIQQTGNVVAVQHVGAKHVADATTKFLGDMRGAHSEMLEKSPEMRTRFQTRFRELGEVAARISGKKELYMRLESSAYAMILWSQAVPDTITWHAAYSRAFEDSPGISDREAADRAFQAVLDTQGSGDLVNLSTIERGGPGSKLLTVFYTWQNTLFNEIYKIAKTEGLSAEGMTRLATLSVVLPFLTVIIRDLVPDDEDELKKRRTGTGAMTVAEQYAWRTLEESINTLLGSVVGVRELASPIASILSGERPFEYRGPAGFAPIADLIAVFNAGAESGVISKRFGKRFLYFLGDLSGIPATQLNRTWDGIDAVMSGDDVPWWAVVLGTQK